MQIPEALAVNYTNQIQPEKHLLFVLILHAMRDCAKGCVESLDWFNSEQRSIYKPLKGQHMPFLWCAEMLNIDALEVRKIVNSPGFSEKEIKRWIKQRAACG